MISSTPYLTWRSSLDHHPTILDGPSVGASCLVTDVLVLVLGTTEEGYRIRPNRSQWFDAKKATLAAD